SSALLVGGVRPRRGGGDARPAARRGPVARRLGLDDRRPRRRRGGVGRRASRALWRAGGGAGAAGAPRPLVPAPGQALRALSRAALAHRLPAAQPRPVVVPP